MVDSANSSPERFDYRHGDGGTRVDEMLDDDSLRRLIEQVTPAPRRSRQQILLSQISTRALRAELARREGVENAGEQ